MLNQSGAIILIITCGSDLEIINQIKGEENDTEKTFVHECEQRKLA